MSSCLKCGSYRLFNNPCRCEMFVVIDEDGESREIFSKDEESAAAKYAELVNIENDYFLLGSSITVSVNGRSFTCFAEKDIRYSTTEN